MDYVLLSCYQTLKALPHTFKLHCVGFGGLVAAKEEFATLQAMAGAFEWAYAMHGVGFFHNSGMHLESLKQTLQTFSASVTGTRTATSLGGAQRPLRPVTFSHSVPWRGPTPSQPGRELHGGGVTDGGGRGSAAGEGDDWLTFPDVVRYHAQPSLSTAWEREEEEVTLHVSRCAFAAGGERNVFHARLEGSSFAWVAKECKHLIDGGHTAEVAFHQNSLVTQATCAAWAGEFNYAVEELGLAGLPAIEVNRCYLVEAATPPASSPDGGQAGGGQAGGDQAGGGGGPPHVRPLFVEPMIDGKFIKWNSNCGDVFPWRAPEGAAADGGTAADGASDGAVQAGDVPQAFTHWTYVSSKATRMVCDLQGFFASGRFVLVDPAIHSAGADRPKGGYGRTDRSSHGMADFFSTHVCNGLCRRLGISGRTAAAASQDVRQAAQQLHQTQSQQQQQLPQQQQPPPPQHGRHQRLCIICEDQPRQVRFLCGHSCACATCADLVRRNDNLCPTCRTPLGLAPFEPIASEGSTTTYVR